MGEINFNNDINPPAVKIDAAERSFTRIRSPPLQKVGWKAAEEKRPSPTLRDYREVSMCL